MFFQNETLFHFEMQRAVTLFIKGFTTRTVSQTCFILEHSAKNTFKQPDPIACGMNPRAALTDKVMTGINITISPIGTVLAYTM
ncbi:hypothetical protein F4Y59_13015 [Candidatus Poribacteria bacterium]|nr:hypothetical protein [Candidatus Poribacteria bacterium]